MRIDLFKKIAVGAGVVTLLGAGLIVGCDRTEDVTTIAETDAKITSRETETTYQKLYKDVETTTKETTTEETTTEEATTVEETETYIEIETEAWVEETEEETVVTEAEYSVEQFMADGVIYFNGWKFTYYSENVLPGDGLNIPGRWSDGYFVRDCDGYICCASSDLDYGTVVGSPFGDAKVYDCGCDSGVIDLYTSF